MATIPSSKMKPTLLPQPKATTIAAVIELIAADTSLSPARRKNLLWGLNIIVKAAGRPADRIGVSLAVIDYLTTGFHPEHAGIGHKSWRNARSCTTFALKHLGLTSTGTPDWVPLLGDWRRLLDAMREVGLRDWCLGRLARYCSARGIGPEEVSDNTLPFYRQALVEESRRNDPDRVVRRTARLWNKARRLVPGWPPVELTVAIPSREVSLPLEAYPVSFQADVAAFLKRISDKTPFRKGRPSRPVSAATLRGRRYQIRPLASALVRNGIPVEAITGLAALVTPEHARLALEFMWQQNGEKTSSHIFGHATALQAIAKYHVAVSPETLEELRSLAAGLDPKQRGLTEKNRGRLRQLDDQRNKALLLHLPRKLQAEAEARDAPDRRGALLMQMAVALELLLMCMLRRQNLVNLDADKHLRWSRAGRAGVCHLAIEAQEVKNREPLEFELAPESADLVKLYLERYQPLLRPTPSSLLFPGQTGQMPKNEGCFSTQIADCVFSRTGLRINAHLFRHIGAKLHLDAQPGSYEVLRRVFGHRSMTTTVQAYCGLEMMAAARHVDKGILAQRRATRALLLRRRPRPIKPAKPVKPVKPVKPDQEGARGKTEWTRQARTIHGELEPWPEKDELAWMAILRRGNPFNKPGRGGHWAPATRDLYRRSYNNWLRFLRRSGRLRVDVDPALRVTPETVAAYLTSLEGLADYTVLLHLSSLFAVCRAMASDGDWTWLGAVICHLRRQGPRGRPKHPRLQDSADLFEAGLAVMVEAEGEGTPLRRAAGYRDGLMLSTLAARPLRRRNFVMIELGRHLVRVGDGWRLLFASHETKTRRPIELPWPERLNAPLERYLDRHRPVLLGGQASDRLWIGQRGRPMDGRAIHKRIAAITRKCFGQPINPHLFRDCFATSIAIRDPEHIRAAAILLGHSQRTNEKHYNQAQALEAGRLYQQGILALRLQLAPPLPPDLRRHRRRRDDDTTHDDPNNEIG